MLFIEDEITQRASDLRPALDGIYLNRPEAMARFPGEKRLSEVAEQTLATRETSPSGRFEGVLVDLGEGALGILTPGTLAEAALADPDLMSRHLSEIAKVLIRVAPGDAPPFEAHNFAVVEGGEVVPIYRNPSYVVLTDSGKKGTHVCG